MQISILIQISIIYNEKRDAQITELGEYSSARMR